MIDTREVEHGAAVRRRRECEACGGRFTTFERCDGAALVVVKRSNETEPFVRAKVVAGIIAATKNRPIGPEAIDALAEGVEQALRSVGREVTSQQIGLAVLERLQEVDEVAYMRFASVYKGFEGAGDFSREAGLLSKQTAPKRSADQLSDRV